MNPADPPAAGAALEQVLIGGAATTALVTFVVLLGLAHRAGRTRILDLIGGPAERLTGLPAWAVLPFALSIGALLTAGLGFVWDVGTHINDGRDEGPFANPSHYMLIVGILGFISAGWLAIAMPRRENEPQRGVRVAPGWVAPAGGVAMLAGGLASFAGFPLDDVWHRLFGQDVTLWGPTHLLMITGGVLHFCAGVVLLEEGRRAAIARGMAPGLLSTALRIQPRKHIAVAAGAIVLVGFSIAYQQEFGYGVPQFQMLFHPMLIALTAGLGLIGVRAYLGRGSAISAAIVAIVLHAGLAAFAGPLMGELTMHFPLYLGAAIAVEAAALVVDSRNRAFPLVAGLGVGVFGTLAEFGWSHAWMPLAWPAGTLPVAIALSIPLAIAGGLISVFAANGFAARPQPRIAGRVWLVPAGSLLVALAILGLHLPASPPAGGASFTLTEVPSRDGRWVQASVRFSDPELVADADWLTAFAWQGGEHAIAQPLVSAGGGVYETSDPLPVHGSWKSAIRYAEGDVMGAIPLYMPADSAIPVAGVAAPASFERAWGDERQLLQRERRPDVPSWLWNAASSGVAILATMLFFVVGWSLRRINSAPEGEPAPAVRAPLAQPRPQTATGAH